MEAIKIFLGVAFVGVLIYITAIVAAAFVAHFKKPKAQRDAEEKAYRHFERTREAYKDADGKMGGHDVD